jgi:sodium-dependent phosphate cotransporter
MASEPDRLAPALQISFCHLFFNLSGIALFYPVPALRRIPTDLAKGLGNTTAKYRWFAVAYLIFGFFMVPTMIFGLSIAGTSVLLGVCVPILLLIIVVVIINVLQSKKPEVLPVQLRSWLFVPEPLRSLEPYDRLFSKIRPRSSSSSDLKELTIV